MNRFVRAARLAVVGLLAFGSAPAIAQEAEAPALAPGLHRVPDPDFELPANARSRLVLLNATGQRLEWKCTRAMGLFVFVFVADERGFSVGRLGGSLATVASIQYGIEDPARLVLSQQNQDLGTGAAKVTLLTIGERNLFTSKLLAAAGDSVRMKYPLQAGPTGYATWAVPSDARQVFSQYYQDCGGKALP